MTDPSEASPSERDQGEQRTDESELASGDPASESTDSRRRWIYRDLVIALALGLSIHLSNTALTRADRLGYGSPDESMFIQLCWNTLNGNGATFTQEAWEGPAERSYFASHLNLLFILYLPLFALAPGHEVLCCLKPALGALGAIPLYALARRRLKSEGRAAAISALFLVSPLVCYNAVRLSSNYLTFPLLLFALERFDRGRLKTAAGLFALAVLGREEIAFQVAAFLLMVAVVDSTKRRTAILVSLGILAYVFLYVGVFKGQFGVGPDHFARYRYLGDSLPAVAISPLRHPVLFFGHLLSKDALLLLFLIVLPFGPAILFAPRHLLAALAPWALVSLSSLATDRVLGPYQVPAIPFLFAGLVIGLARLKEWEPSLPRKLRRYVSPSLLALVCTASLTLLVWQSDSGPLVRFRSLRSLDPEPLQILAAATPGAPEVVAAAAAIPTEAAVSASPTLLVHLACRRYLYPFPGRADEVDFIVVDTRTAPPFEPFNPRWPWTSPEAHAAEIDRLVNQPGASVSRLGFFLVIDRRGVQGAKLSRPQ